MGLPTARRGRRRLQESLDETAHVSERDRLLHHAPVDVDSVLTEAATALERHVLPHLRALPAAVPLVVLADLGFQENRSWGRGSSDR